ncbi:MAG: CFI-box-CTERM domain-containing protein [Candidatus Omnitrophota bacterium]
MFYKKTALILVICLNLFCVGGNNNVFGYETFGKWADSSIPVPYYINADGSDNISDGSDLTACQTSFQTWTNVATTDIAVTYLGTSTSTSGGTLDGVNLLSWVENTADPRYVNTVKVAGTIAVCVAWVSSGTIVDADIIFNGADHTWSTSGAGGAMDVQNLATHEIGHFFGLDDLYTAADTEKTMYGYGSTGETKKRDLHQDDIDGISALYPYSGIIDFSANSISVADASWNTLSWKNPSRSTFVRTMIRYRTDGTHPANTSDGTLLVLQNGTPGASEYYNHTGLIPNTTYYYTAFAFDSVNGYNAPNDASKKSAASLGAGGVVDKGAKSDCFVATACYGNMQADEVKSLREFRDKYLKKTVLGKEFVRGYYLIGPYFAQMLNENFQYKGIVRMMLKPAVKFADFVTKGGCL